MPFVSPGLTHLIFVREVSLGALGPQHVSLQLV